MVRRLFLELLGQWELERIVTALVAAVGAKNHLLGLSLRRSGLLSLLQALPYLTSQPQHHHPAKRSFSAYFASGPSFLAYCAILDAVCATP
jgi:hypothetical protein